MNKTLTKYNDRFKLWDEKRIKSLYERLKKDGIITIETFSLESANHNVKEILRTENKVKSNHFMDDSVNTITQYYLTFWDEIQTQLTIKNSNKEEDVFIDWFTDLLELDIDENGLNINDEDNFIVEWGEITDNESTEIWKALEEEGLV
jgi:predicted RNA-binding protein Jag